MNIRPLEKGESTILQELTASGIEPEVMFITATGLKKSILDATAPVRIFLKQEGLHDFNEQAQGQTHKRKIQATLFCGKSARLIDVSLYRPVTKQGDPRIWPSKLNHYAKDNDVIALFTINKRLRIINLTREDENGFCLKETRLGEILSSQKGQLDERSYELYGLLKKLSKKGPIKGVGTGSTSIGRSIESALGIEMNSSKNPDFHGIEIKSKRSTTTTRDTLFAQVPNWKLSRVQNAREILDLYGYLRDGIEKKLYCTVSSIQANTQGLLLNLDHDAQILEEFWKKANLTTQVCIWQLKQLHQRLESKHQETFWIKATPIEKKNGTYFRLDEALHTRSPSLRQFDRLIDTGEITVDHLLKRQNGKFTDKGHLFKMKASAKKELFIGEEKCYSFK